MAIGRRAGVDGLAQIQLPDDGRRGQAEHQLNGFFQTVVGTECSSAEGIYRHHDRLRLADGVSQCNLAPAGKTCRHDVLGNIPGHIGAAAIHLGGVFAGESASPVGNKHAIAVHHEFPPGQAGIRFRAAKDKTAGGVHQDLGVLVGREIAQRRSQDLIGQLPAQFILLHVRAVLGGDHDRVQTQGLAVLVVFHGDLGFAVRAQAGDQPCFSDSG